MGKLSDYLQGRLVVTKTDFNNIPMNIIGVITYYNDTDTIASVATKGDKTALYDYLSNKYKNEIGLIEEL